MSEKMQYSTDDNSLNFKRKVSDAKTTKNTDTINRRSINQFEQGETVKVCLRIRPMVQHETNRKLISVLERLNDNTCHMNINGNMREYKYSHVFNENTSQVEIFANSGVTQLLNSVLEG